VKAVDEAAAKPENASIVAHLKSLSMNDSIFRRSWSLWTCGRANARTNRARLLCQLSQRRARLGPPGRIG
jgi:hypothetical protein